MGLFDKIKEMKDTHDAKKASEAAELLALCNRLRQNQIFLDYADKLYNMLKDPGASCIQWACGGGKKEYRNLAILVTPSEFGLVSTRSEEYRDSNGQKQFDYEMEIIDVQNFADYGMQTLPNKKEVKQAVLETLASKLKDIRYLSLQEPGQIAGNDNQYFDGIRISVLYSAVQNSRASW